MKTTKKQKSITPIQFPPHDGPIFFSLYNSSSLSSSSSSSPPSSSIRRALWLIQRTQDDRDENDIDDVDCRIQRMDDDGATTARIHSSPSLSSSLSSVQLEQRCIKLCCDLQGKFGGPGGKEQQTTDTTNSITSNKRFTTKEQLQYLQAFKCWLLENVVVVTDNDNNKKKISIEKENDDVVDDHNNNDDELNHHDHHGPHRFDVLQDGLYRLLLEWSLSYETPLPFQRAIQSNLKTILDVETATTTTTTCQRGEHENEIQPESKSCFTAEEINMEVLVSIWTTADKADSHSNCSCCYWKDPIHTLDVAVNFPQLLSVIHTHPKLWYDCLQFLYCQLISLSQHQDQDLHPRSISNGEDDINGSNAILLTSSFTLSSQEELQTALRVGNIMKIVLGGNSCQNSNDDENDGDDDDDDPARRFIRRSSNNTQHQSLPEKTPTKNDVANLLFKLQDAVLILLKSPNMLTEGFNTLGILYGRLVFLLSGATGNNKLTFCPFCTTFATI